MIAAATIPSGWETPNHPKSPSVRAYLKTPQDLQKAREPSKVVALPGAGAEFANPHGTRVSL